SFSRLLRPRELAERMEPPELRLRRLLRVPLRRPPLREPPRLRAAKRSRRPMETRATLYGVRLSAQKGRLVADQVRGLPVEKALNLLAFSPKKGAHIIKKVLESAIANAEHNDGADVDELKVKTILVEQGMSLKRFQARAKGRGNSITKRTCHIFVTVG